MTSVFCIGNYPQEIISARKEVIQMILVNARFINQKHI